MAETQKRDPMDQPYLTDTEVKAGLSTGVKVLLGAIVFGAVAAGVYVAFALSR